VNAVEGYIGNCHLEITIVDRVIKPRSMMDFEGVIIFNKTLYCMHYLLHCTEFHKCIIY
jgi:hypothetical protein